MTENVFLDTLREQPDDDTTRRVFADWLDEQDDPTCTLKAEYIRTDLELATMPRKPKRKSYRRLLADRRRELAGQLDLDWMATVTLAKIEACTFAFQCPLKWESLQMIEGETTVRHCSACNEKVFYCGTMEDTRRHALAGHCVAVDARAFRQADDLYEEPFELDGMLMGDISLPEENEEG
jgi:uncharacterized protein (TIGR02996 family)